MNPKTRQKLDYALKALQDEGFDVLVITRDLREKPCICGGIMNRDDCKRHGQSSVEVLCMSRNQYPVPEMAAMMLRELAGPVDAPERIIH